LNHESQRFTLWFQKGNRAFDIDVADFFSVSRQQLIELATRLIDRV
jgi:hypothetical protein